MGYNRPGMAIILERRDYVRVEGADARAFLQGQTSCDMSRLSPARSLRGALCNLKGRVLADFRAILLDEGAGGDDGGDGADAAAGERDARGAGEAILLQTSAGMADIILATLGKYAVFSKVSLSKVEPPPPSFGFLGDDAGGDLKTHFGNLPEAIDDCAATPWGPLLRVGRASPRFELIQTLEPFNPPEQQAAARWHCAAIRDGEVHVTPALSGTHTPQLLNYDLSGIIDFEKGCYTGQEVVARMYYRGKPKQRMFLLRGNTPADTLLNQDTILTAATDPDNGETVALAILPIPTPGTLTLADPKHTLQVEPLNYGAPE